MFFYEWILLFRRKIHSVESVNDQKLQKDWKSQK